MMLDHDTARGWADHHHGFTHWVNDLLADTAEAFRVLTRLQYRQPWLKNVPERDTAKTGAAA